MANIAQRTLAGGEVSPSFYAHTDLAKYAQSFRRCRNFFITKTGAVVNRPGTEFVSAVKTAAESPRLIEWIFNDSQAYALEFGKNYLRFFQLGAPLRVTSAPAWGLATVYAVGDVVVNAAVYYYATTAHTAAAADQPGVGAQWQTRWVALASSVLELASPYALADLPLIQWVQDADVMTLVCPGYRPYELRRRGAVQWVLAPITFGPLITAPTSLALSGGIAGADTWYAVTAIGALGAEESLPSILKIAIKQPDPTTPIAVTWQPVTGAIQYHVYRSLDGTTWGLVQVVGSTPTLYTDSTWGTPSAAVTSTTPGVLTVAAGQARNATVAVANEKSTTGTYRITAQLIMSESGGGAPTTSRVKIYGKRSTDAARVFLAVTPDVTLYGAGTNVLNIDQTVTIADDGYTTLEFDLVPEVTLATGGTTTTATVTGTAVAYTRAQTSFNDTNVTVDYLNTPPVQPALFDAVPTYPAVVGQYQQRLLLGNTPLQPEMTFASRTALERNFTAATPLNHTDPVSWRLKGRKVNLLRHLIDLNVLLEFTSGGVYAVEGDQSGIIKPDAINPRLVSPHGAATVAPVPVSETVVLYLQARGQKIRSLIAGGGQGAQYGGEDMTVFSNHLFDGYTVTDMAWAEEPFSVLWVVRSDGVLLSLTFLPEQQIAAWTRHDTQGTVENISCVPEGSRDALYMVVARTMVGGTVNRYVERLSRRIIVDPLDGIFMDAALSYDGRATGTLTFTRVGGVAVGDPGRVQCVAPAGTFVAGDVGNELLVVKGFDTLQTSYIIDTYVSGTTVTGHFADYYEPLIIGTVVTGYAFARKLFSGLGHLEGLKVSVVGDGFVESSPNNIDYPVLTVTGGMITLGTPRAVVHVGLPYTSDLETLDIDRASGPSMKESALLVNTVGLYVEASRGGYFGGAPPTNDAVDPLERLYELRSPAVTTYADAVAPRSEEVEVSIQNSWNKHGRVFIRQVDPLPMAILAIWPSGYLPQG